MKHLKKSFIELADTSPFSPAFEAAIGLEHVRNIQRIDDDVLRFCIFAGLVEHVAFRQLCLGNNPTLNSILRCRDDGFSIQFEKTDYTIRWGLNLGPLDRTGFIALFKVVLNLSEKDAVATLARVLGIAYEKVFAVFDDKHATETGILHSCGKDIPSRFHISGQPAGRSLAELIESANIYGYTGQIIGAFAQYRLGNTSFCLPATVGNGSLGIGMCKATAHLLDQKEIDANPTATVLVCQDIRITLALRKMFFDSRELTNAEIIITGHIGNDLSVIPWGYLDGRDVVLICAPRKEALALVKAYKEFILGAGAKSFKVYPYPLLFADDGNLPENHSASAFDEIETELLANARYLSKVERPSILARQIKETAMDYGAYVMWGCGNRLFKSEKTDRKESVVDPLFRPGNLKGMAVKGLADISLEDAFPRNGITMLHGEKNVGKSSVVLSFIRTLVAGESFFGLNARGTFTKCMLFDSETPPDVFANRLEQFGLDRYIAQSFFPICKCTLPVDNPWASFDIMRKDHRELLRNYLAQKGVNYLLLDNLTSLSKPGTAYSQTATGELFEYLQSLATAGIGVIMVHHTLRDKNKMRGSDELSIRCHTEIMLLGKEYIKRDNSAPEIVRERAGEAGATIGIYFKTCKAVPVLEQQVHWHNLPLGSSTWESLGATDVDGVSLAENMDTVGQREQKIEATTLPEEHLTDAGAAPEACATPPALPALSQDETIIHTRIKENGKTTCKEACGLLGRETSTAQKIFKSLIEKGLIEKIGEGRATHYQLRS